MRSATHRWHPVSHDALGMRRFPFLSSAFLLVVALVPRIWDLGHFVTFDEANFWIRRSEAFFQALRSGDLAATAITVHPGVTTMWLGGAGLLLHQELLAGGLLVNDTFTFRLAFAQLPVALAHTGGVLLGYWLLRRLLQPSAAFLAALLWATDPFVIGYSRILHVDALAGTFLTLSLLAACVYWHHQRRWRFLVLSAICASLAMLSKSPAAALLPLIGVVALTGPACAQPGELGRSAGAAQRRRQAVGALLGWGAIALATSAILWPVLLVAPVRAYELLQLGVSAEGAQPHQLGNFFLGQVYADADPGLRFYPVALALRATPWTLIGLLVLPLVFGQLGRRTRRDVLVLAAFVILFTATMDVFPKKFDRYLVPAFPAIDILAAVGLAGLLDLLWQLRPGRRRGTALAREQGIASASKAKLLHESSAHPQQGSLRTPTHIRASGLQLAGISVIGAMALINIVLWHPYEIGAFNQILGGARTGAATFVVGWGEGLEQAAAWLNRQPDITGVTVAAARTEPLQPYLRHGAQAVAPAEQGFDERSGYAVVYLPDVQGGPPWPPFDQVFGHLQPAHEVVIHGVTYAWIYQLPPPVAHPLATGFGPGLSLRGYSVKGVPRPATNVTVSLSWATAAQPPNNVALFVHLLGRDGARHAQADPVLPVEAWGPNRYFTTEIALALPPDLAPGHYDIVIGVYDRASGRRLALAPTTGAPNADGQDALTLAEIDVPAP